MTNIMNEDNDELDLKMDDIILNCDNNSQWILACNDTLAYTFLFLLELMLAYHTVTKCYIY